MLNALKKMKQGLEYRVAGTVVDSLFRTIWEERSKPVVWGRKQPCDKQGIRGRNKPGLSEAKKKKKKAGSKFIAYFQEGPHKPVQSGLRDFREAGCRIRGWEVKLDPGRVCPSHPLCRPQVLLHRAAESLLLSLPGALDPS